MARVVHFEIPVDDPDRARSFYQDVFGWELQSYGDFPYWLATTGEDGEAGIDGALIGRSDTHAAPVVIVGVASVDDALERAKAAGAEVVVGKQAIPGIGYSGYLRDTEGNVVGVFEAAEAAG